MKQRRAATCGATMSGWSIPETLPAPSCLYNEAPCRQRGCKSSHGPRQSWMLQEMWDGRQTAALSTQRCLPSSGPCPSLPLLLHHPQLLRDPQWEGSQALGSCSCQARTNTGSEQSLEESWCHLPPAAFQPAPPRDLFIRSGLRAASLLV